MSLSSDRGRNFELKVARILRSKLGAKVTRDSRSGAGTNKSDISDYYQQIPLHMELKDQETIKAKEWFRQADASASFAQAATVVFNADEEVLAIIRFSDLVNFLVEIADQKAEIDDLRLPVPARQPGVPKDLDKEAKRIEKVVAKHTEQKIKRGAFTCRAGHIADDYGYCMQLNCKYSRGYKPPKAKRGK